MPQNVIFVGEFIMDENLKGTTRGTDPFLKLKQSELPVFFLQLGSNTSLFFDKVLKQAALSNGHHNLFILTDTKFDQYSGYNCIDISGFTAGVQQFDKVYRHHSTNPVFFEKSCFDRWFIINDLVKSTGISNFVYGDCDVLVLEDLKPVFREYVSGKYDGTIMYFERGEDSVSSAHTSFWNAKLINDFCDFILAKYADMQGFERLLQDATAGKFLDNHNVSDMILLDVFRTETRPNTLNLLSLEEKGISIDFNVNVSFNGIKHHFVIDPGTKIKKMVKRGGSLFGHITGGAEPQFSKFYTLHFQGYVSKTLIPLHVKAQSVAEYLSNYLSAKLEYTKRTLKLFKNRVKNRLTKK